MKHTGIWGHTHTCGRGGATSATEPRLDPRDPTKADPSLICSDTNLELTRTQLFFFLHVCQIHIQRILLPPHAIFLEMSCQSNFAGVLDIYAIMHRESINCFHETPRLFQFTFCHLTFWVPNRASITVRSTTQNPQRKLLLVLLQAHFSRSCK